MEKQKQFTKAYSFEFFPPKTPKGEDKLMTAHAKLAELNPRFFSVTFGAGGSTRERTLETVMRIKETGSDAAPHISCIASNKAEILDLLHRYKEGGIKHLVALRGDMPSGSYSRGEFSYANELVEFIREETGDTFFIEVAAYPEFHPQAPDAEQDFQNFLRKAKSGADSAITQYFYNAEAYYYFVDRCEKHGVDIPIVPGIMPITNYEKIQRFSDACGADIPRWMRKQMQAYGDDQESVTQFSTDVVTRLCEQLLDAGAPGLHFYSLNQAEPTTTIWKNLGLPR